METVVKKELLYDGIYYDVTNWVKRHPGGNIIEIFTATGEDSTIVVQQYHQRSTKKVMSIMKSLPQRPAKIEELKIESEKTERYRALTKDFLELYQELQAEGMFKPPIFNAILRLSEAVFLMWLGSYFFNNLPLQFGIGRIVGVILVAFSVGRSGWVAHEGGHHSLTGISKLDRNIERFIYGVYYGISGSWWTSQHSRHHAMPQNLKYDVDLKTLPILAFNGKVVENPEEGKTFFVQNQKWLFATLDSILVAFLWKFYLHPKYCFHKKKYFDLLCMAFHYYLLFVIIGFGPLDYLVGVFLSATYLLGNFALSHTHMPITEEPNHWVEYALCYTTDIRSSWWIDYWMGYLNFQIEHHLFPSMPEFRNKLASKRVKALAKKHNLPYHLCSYTEAVVKTFENLGAVSKELAL